MSSSSDDQYNNCPICLSSVFGPAGGDDDDDNNNDGNHTSNNTNIDRNEICATVPCGHLYHHKCFKAWQSSQQQSSGRGSGKTVKCPTCNVRTTSCIKLFLSLEGLISRCSNDDDDDDISLSSVEEESVVADDGDDDDDDDDDDEEEEVDPNGAVDVEDDYDENDCDSERRLQMSRRTSPRIESPTAIRVDVVDLTLSPQPRQQQEQHKEEQHIDPILTRTGKRRRRSISNTTSTSITTVSTSTATSSTTTDPQSSSSLQRLTRIAKGYKRKYLQGKVQFQSYREETKRWTEKLKNYETQVTTLQIENDRKDQEMEEMEKGLEASHLKEEENWRLFMRASSEGMRKDGLLAGLVTKYAALEKENAGLHAHYQRKLEQAQAKPELHQVLEDHPKVVDENRRLKEELYKLSTQIRHHQTDSTRMMGPTGAVEVGGSSKSDKRVNSSKEMARALRQLDAQVRNVGAGGSNSGIVPFRSIESHHGKSSSSNNNNNNKKQPPPASSSSIPKKSSKPVVVDCARYSAMASRMIPASKGKNFPASKNAAFAKAMLSSSSSSSSSSIGGNNNSNNRGSYSSSSTQPPAGTIAMTSLSVTSQHKKRPKTNSAFRRGIFD